ncbi:ABC transporter permease subunit [Amycolatopsis nigrescens]|uniref:ABC transporter permease subunit n=1 Tax=Amycolatopsis nigrescens TaxID=381445 RepID=UPI000376F2FD|nr:ABC transporter permease subunit [Amycolatopsis nigrescens]
MTTLTTTANFGHVLRSESTKLRSLRSTWYTALVTMVLGIGVGALSASAQAGAYHLGTAEDRAAFDPTAVSLTSLIVAQLAIGVLGTLVITSEYATGMVRTSLAAVPRRGRLLAAKGLTFAAVALVVGEIITFASFLIGQGFFAGAGVPHAALDQPGVLRAVFGGGLYLVVIGLLGLGLGVLTRSTAGAISLLVTLTLLVRPIAQALPEAWAQWMNRYWPSAAGERIITVLPDPDALAPWAGFGLLCGFVAAVLFAGYLLLRTRDA